MAIVHGGTGIVDGFIARVKSGDDLQICAVYFDLA